MAVEPSYEELLKKVAELELEACERKKTENRNQLLETQLRQAQKMEAIGLLAGGIAHDFNNILASIIGYAELSVEDVAKESIVGNNLRQILIAGKRARDLVSQILSFSRKTNQVSKPVHLNPVLKEVARMLRSMLPTSIEIKTNDCPKMLTVRSEPSQIYQVLINLCTNAAQAMSNGNGFLEINLSETISEEKVRKRHPEMGNGSYATIEVRDNGTGIPPEILDHIFDPYFTAKDQDKGTGLGLAVVKGIVRSHGGCIDVFSAPGAGADFRIYLPLIETDEDSTKSDATLDLPSGTGRILFVDDEPIIVNMQKHMLERIGYTVTAECCSLKALATFKAAPYEFDAIITDMTMPGMTGDRLARAAKEIRPDIPVLLCTGYSENIGSGDARESGIDDFLMKPVEKATIARTLNKVLGSAKH